MEFLLTIWWNCCQLLQESDLPAHRFFRMINITERTFGGYISIYDFKRAVEDKATVPLYYENRGEKILDINNPDITDKILDAIEAVDLDPEQEEKLEHEFEKEIHLLTAEPRLKSVARDFCFTLL